MSLFVDTSALYAAMDRDDEFHGRASAQWKECLSGPEVLVTFNYTLVSRAGAAKVVRTLW